LAHSPKEPAAERPELIMQWQVALAVYQHHFDLFLKAVFLYFAIVGALAGFIYKGNLPIASQKTLSVLIGLLSIVAMLGCWMSRQWVKKLRVLVDTVARELHIQEFPFNGALSVAGLFAWTAGALTILALINAYWFIR